MSTTTTSIYNNKKSSNGVVGGKTARACDSCVKKRARWYCAADDAFLCQSCDHSVHSANSLARRHERVRLKTSSSRSPPPPLKLAAASDELPSWHRGFTRKARTPRNGSHASSIRGLKLSNKPNGSSSGSSGTVPNPFSLVPEYCNGDETSNDENEEQLLYRVPIYDPFVAGQLCNSPAEVSKSTSFGANNDINGTSPDEEENNNNNNLQGLLFPAQEMDDLAEFAADVESLLGHGLENDACFGMEGLGFVDSKDERETTTTDPECASGEGRAVKVEEDEDEAMGGSFEDMMREPFQLNLDDYDESPAPSYGEEDAKVGLGMTVAVETKGDNGNDANDVVKKNSSSTMMLIKKKKKKKQILLRLDYEAVSTAWATQGGSPWTTGDRPDFDPDACLPECMMSSSTDAAQIINQSNNYLSNGSGVVIGGLINAAAAALGDEGREARVSRYREKRRTRLFSKKIRYEVRKLNAEKRPRMKGRFVKRSSYVPSTITN
ncbi:zinc finger protein CONSTANS-LIKE 16-like [Humulus lupulus]|uniref:zinc finger protein CONSTANS-LIKE 16-like n=1 Tax=Humulus lupulus TaxID=3486 RepID=UPI002B4054AB|nr:zinc finger protein CONSTANS-LIKE 16-like [Humulus lupulus]XP_062110123.1 zinc finger protein CONSTANS-LIKE 16-like [Humulus lupulus]